MNSCILLFGGSSSRFGQEDKLHAIIDGKPVWRKAFDTFLNASFIDEVVVVVKDVDCEIAKTVANMDKVVVAVGGDSRFMSVYNGLQCVCKDCDVVAIHDGARAFVSEEIIRSSFDSAIKYGSGVCGVHGVDTLRTLENGVLKGVIDRDNVVSIQTPQTFSYQKILVSYQKCFKDNAFKNMTDDSMVYSKYIGDCNFVLGDRDNVKITYKGDLPKDMKFGVGYDIHKLVEGRELFLCGVNVESSFGLLGHSDGDAPIHALMDSILSALGKKDIGHYFPDNDDSYLGIDSKLLLKRVVEIAKEDMYKVTSVTIAIVCEKPRLSPYIDEMKAVLADILCVSNNCVGITVTTNEGVPMADLGGAIASYATAVLER